ncbi:MAG: hypothetical protein H6817_05655 [Phycisphaerales bacterium]|nr:hypothetical protein [Phycisphaerales bacterium]
MLRSRLLVVTTTAAVVGYAFCTSAKAADCNTTGFQTCGIQEPADCRWHGHTGDCELLPAGSVEQHLCEFGIRLDGNVGDAIKNGTVILDQAPDAGNVFPGMTGYGDQPRDNGDPNGFNVERSVLLFVPDTDPLAGKDHDNSFLYIGWDIADFDADGIAPTQFDSDDDGRACIVTGGHSGTSDDKSERYDVDLQICTDVDNYDPQVLDPNNIDTDQNVSLSMRIDPGLFPFLYSASLPGSAIPVADLLTFPTADNNTDRSNGCIDREVRLCGAGNDIEMIVKHVESQAVFGASPMERRFALAQLLARLRGASSGDLGDEEVASAVNFTSLPSIEVSKEVRCAETGNLNFGTNAIALPGSLVEMQIVIENTGNRRLNDVIVTDVMESVGSQAGDVTVEPVCETLTAMLTRDGATTAITPANAAIFGLNVTFFIDTCVNPNLGFLGAVRNDSPIELGDLLGARVSRDDGDCTLLPGDKLVLTYQSLADVTDEEAFCSDFVDQDARNAISVSGTPPIPVAPSVAFNDPCTFSESCNDGRFCNGVEQCVAGFCQAGTPPCAGIDICDEFSNTCGFDDETTTFRNVADAESTIDTPAEFIADKDNNVITIDLRCRGFDFIKEVGFPGMPGSFMSGTNGLQLPPIPPGSPLDVEFRYSGNNTGEVAEAITISDPQLCADLADVGVTIVDCPLCDSNGTYTAVVQPGDSYSTSCVVRFENQDQLTDFLSRDDNRPECSAEMNTCYRNCATATADAYDLGEICDGAPTLQADSIATICGETCLVDVIKEVRCLPDCVPPLDPDAGWVTDPDELEVLPGACVQYRITATNISDDVDICELLFVDDMLNSNAFISGPDNVQVIPPACPLLPGQFNWDGAPAMCGLQPGQPVPPGGTVTVLFDAKLAPDVSPDAELLNIVSVLGASFCDPTPNFFDCEDVSTVGLDVRECGIEVTKDVTCDNPRSPNAVFEPELAETIPGATLGFRVQVCNDGDVTVPRVEIDDELSCSDWYIAGSVVADIEGVDVTGCVCPGGNCTTIDDLDGLKDLTACVAEGIPTNGCLDITFEVSVPADFSTTGTPVDCTNTITVGAFSDVCSASSSTACDEDSDDAKIDVQIPDIECDKTVCADLNNNGSCDDPNDLPFSSDLDIPCDASFPLTLIYRGEVTNTGETPLAGVSICDDNLVADALAAGLNIVSCDLCSGACDGTNDTCAGLVNLNPNTSAVALCRIQVPSREAWETFAGLDDDGSAECHTNGMHTQAHVSANDYCTEDADDVVESSCEARVCVAPRCAVSVMKGVRCIDGCVSRSVNGDARFADAPPGDFDGNGIMDLRDFAMFTECHFGPDIMPAPTDARLSAMSCLAAFDFDGDHDVDIRDCAYLESARMGVVDSLPAAPGASVEFEIKATNEGNEPICELNFRDELMGDIHLCEDAGVTATVVDSNGDHACVLPADWIDTNGVTFTLNLQQDCGVLLEPTGMVLIHFPGVVGLNATGVVKNHVEVDCAPDDGNGCPNGGTVCGEEAMDDAMIPVLRCDFDLTKDVTCDEPRLPDGMLNTNAFYEAKVESIPGATNGFRIELCNTGDAAITTIGISEVLDCEDWYVANSVVANIGGDDVTACLCDGGSCATLAAINSNALPLPVLLRQIGANDPEAQYVGPTTGTKDLTACHAGGLLPGECMVITFEVVVPPDYSEFGLMPDCTNKVTVEGFTELCGPPDNPCPQKMASADIDVLRPDVDCGKSVCLDADTNGACDTFFLPGLNLPCETEFPFNLIYEIRVSNPGETPLVNAQACDPDLIADAAAAGFEFENCQLCDGPCDGVNDECADLGPLALFESKYAYCTIKIPNRDAWLAFADLDMNTNAGCYTNNSEGRGAIDTELYCTDDVDPDVASGCSVDVCLEPRCNIDITCPDPLKIDCEDPTDPSFTGEPMIFHDCDFLTTNGYRDTIIPGDCPQSYTIKRTWFAEAPCNVHASCDQIIDVNDKNPPVLTCPGDMELDCGDIIPPCDTNGVAIDSCGVPQVDCIETRSPGACPSTIFRELVATDECGNVSSCGYTITIDDTTPPEIECPTNAFFECFAGSSGMPWVHDDCDPDPSVRYVDDPMGDCPLTINRTWIAVDDCGNTNSCMQVIEVDDTEPPVLTCPNDMYLDCNDTLPPCNTNGVAADTCGLVGVDCVETRHGDTCPTTIDRELIATDVCGNVTTCGYHIYIDDTTPPTITCPADLFFECSAGSTGFPTVRDDCDPDPEVTYHDDRSGDCPYTLKRWWEVVDDCGNTNGCVQTITVDDREPPTLTCPASMRIDCSDEIPAVSTDGVVAMDSCGPVEVVCTDIGTTGTCPEISTRICVATDLCGNTSTCGYSITIVDTNGPELACPDDIRITCEDDIPPCDTNGVLVGNDCHDADVYCVDTELPGMCPRTIWREYVATDDCDNVTTCGHYIYIGDDEPPVIECPMDAVIDCTDPVPPISTDGVIAMDSCGPVNLVCRDLGTTGTCPQVSTRECVATDECGNVSSCGYTITIVDTNGPELACPDDIRLNCEDDIPACDTNGVLVGDDCHDAHVRCVDTPIPGSCPTMIWREYIAADDCDNVSTCGHYIIIDDEEPPTIECPAPIEVPCDRPIPDCTTDGVVAMDSCGTVTVACAGDYPVGDSCPETIIRKYKATDDCGNVTTCGQIITVVDEEPPLLICPPMLELECDEPIPPCDTNGVIAMDSCGSVVVECRELPPVGACPTLIEREYVATDDCGNVTTCGQLIYIDDTTPPEITCPDDDECVCTSAWRLIDFSNDGINPLPAGFIFDGYFPGLGVTVTTDNATPGHPDLAIIFDSANPTGNDPDLATPGYHATNTVPYGNVLIIAQDDIDTSPADTLVDDPNDEAGRPQGWIDLAFDDSFTDAVLVICDVDQGETGGSIDFYLNAALVGSRAIVELGDNSIQEIAFDGGVFNRIRVNMPGSGSIPEIRLKPVCEPDCEPGVPTVTDNCDTNAVVHCYDIATTGVGSGGSAYQWDWDPGQPEVWYGTAAGEWESVHGEYNATTQKFVWEVVFSNQVTEGMTFVVNNGPMPENVESVWVMFFLDATDMGNLKLLAYTYNGRNDRSSWYDGDPITAGSQGGDLVASSLIDASFINELSVTDFGGKRKFRFSIDASGINSHVPLFPNHDGLPYQGVKFDGGIGMWLGAYVQLATSYNMGRLTQWAHVSPNGYFDTGHLDTEFSCTPGEIIRKCEASDDCGNVSTCSYRVVLEECQTCECTPDGDTTPPVLTCPPDATVACGDSTDPNDTGMATATDECDPFPTVWFEDSNPFARNTNIIRTWHAIDRCGNESTCEQTITVEGGDDIKIFWETFNGYSYFPDQYPTGDPINVGLPLKSEGANEVWYGGRFEGGGGTINSDLAVQQAGGDGNFTPVGRVDDDAGLLFKVDTRNFTQATLTFRWRTFDVDTADNFVMGYYVGDIDFSGDTPDGEHDDSVHRFDVDGPDWDTLWTELVRQRSSSWKYESFALPTGEETVWVAFWIDGEAKDFAKIDDIKVKVGCPAYRPVDNRD